MRTLSTEIGPGITIAIRDGFSLTFPAGDQVDFQVEAMIGYVHRDVSQAFAPWVFTGEKSDWSNTRTLSLPTASSPPTPSPETTPFPTNHNGVGLAETEIIIGAIVAAAVIGAGLGFLIYLIKTR